MLLENRLSAPEKKAYRFRTTAINTIRPGCRRVSNDTGSKDATSKALSRANRYKYQNFLGYPDGVQHLARKRLKDDLAGSSGDFPRSRHPGARQAEHKRCRVCGRLGKSAEGTRPLR